MKFHLLGNEALVDYTIRCNLCSAVQPEALQYFMQRWKQYIETPDFRQPQEYSKQRPVGHVRRSQKIRDLQHQIERGKWINDWIHKDWNNWWRLSALDDELKAIEATSKGIAFPGAASNIMHFV